MSDLHGKIMNLQANPDHWDASSDGRLTYKQGHRDARHDAAELALAADQEIAALRAQLATARAGNERWLQNSIESWQAFVAMRNDLNEHLPMPSLEGDLLSGPEVSHFCASVVQSVVSQLATARADALRAAAKEIREGFREHDAALCCNGVDCGCQGASVHEMMAHVIETLPAINKETDS